MSCRLSTLPNGLRVITDQVPEMHTVAIGVWCNVGTKNEAMQHNGIAHLVEHMMFKGTQTRTFLQISEEVEDVGGQFNAYTSREHTAYYIHLLKEDLQCGVDILSDILQNSTFPEEELEKERQVILQEIGMRADTPDDLVFDLYQQAAYPDQPFGWPISGTTEIVSRIPRDELPAYVRMHYTPENMVISAAGALDHDQLVTMIGDAFGAMQPSPEPDRAPPARYQGLGDSRTIKDLEQAHIVLGFQGISRLSADYDAALLLSIILGGGASSRLFHEVREKRGLVYSIFSHHTAYHDDGQFEIYAGTGETQLAALMPILCEELNTLRSTDVNAAELQRAKAQLRAALLMGQESMLSRADRQAKQLLHFGRLPDLEARINTLSAVTTADIARLATQIFHSPPTLAALGPVQSLAPLPEIMNKL